MNSSSQDIQSIINPQPIITNPNYNNEHNPNSHLHSNSKEEIITYLQTKVIDLEQKLQTSTQTIIRYKELQIEYNTLLEEKISICQTNKLNRETLNNQILDIRSENEELRLKLNSKLILNQQLLQDKANLTLSLQTKVKDNEELNKQIEDLTNQLNKTKKEQNAFINLFKEQELTITLLREENEELLGKINSLKNGYDNYIDQVQMTTENDMRVKERISANKKLIAVMKSKIEYLNIENNCNNTELNILKIKLDNEKEYRKDREQEVNHLKEMISTIEKTIGECKCKEKRNEDRIEINTLRNQLMQVHQQNNYLLAFIENNGKLKSINDNDNDKNKTDMKYPIRNRIFDGHLNKGHIGSNNTQYPISTIASSVLNTESNESVTKENIKALSNGNEVINTYPNYNSNDTYNHKHAYDSFSLIN